MTESTEPRQLPSTVGWIAGALVGLGILLSYFVHGGLLVIAALGAFGPGLLRELGVLADHDEFQRQAAHRAGYHAYLIGGTAALLAAALLSSTEADLGSTTEWVRWLLLVLWLSWMFSALLAYWGAARTAARVLLAFGTFWAVFVIVALVNEPWGTLGWQGVLAVLWGGFVVLPFFALAWTAGRRPRFTGVMLLVVAAGLFVIAGIPGAGNLPLATVLMTDTLLLVPLVASGVALLREPAGAP